MTLAEKNLVWGPGAYEPVVDPDGEVRNVYIGPGIREREDAVTDDAAEKATWLHAENAYRDREAMHEAAVALAEALLDDTPVGHSHPHVWRRLRAAEDAYRAARERLRGGA